MEYGLIGEHLGHSFSKEIHERIASYKYDLCEVSKEDIDSFMKEKNFKAINVTIPYKETVIPYIDILDESAKLVGAVNTIVNNNGVLTGYNTDYYGLIDLIKYLGLNLKDKDVLILGTGGASKACFAAAKTLNAKSITKVSRKRSDSTITYDEIDYDKYQIIINSTPIGMYPNNEGVIVDVTKFSKLEGVVDCIYNPLRPNLVLDGLKMGVKALGGLYMLVSQAVYAIEKFIGLKYNPDTTLKIYNELYNKKENIVLIGMPSCGKSTIGEYLETKLNRKLVDTDKEIEKRIDCMIKDFFEKYGEQEFRRIESEVVSEVSKQSGIIISTGGGVILNSKNIDNLKQNGKVFFIDRSLENLVPTDSRPLSSDLISLKKRYDERIDIYRSSADVIIDNNNKVEDAINKISEELK